MAPPLHVAGGQQPHQGWGIGGALLLPPVVGEGHRLSGEVHHMLAVRGRGVVAHRLPGLLLPLPGLNPAGQVAPVLARSVGHGDPTRLLLLYQDGQGVGQSPLGANFDHRHPQGAEEQGILDVLLILRRKLRCGHLGGVAVAEEGLPRPGGVIPDNQHRNSTGRALDERPRQLLKGNVDAGQRNCHVSSPPNFDAMSP